MRRGYSDFCLDKDTVLTNHPCLKDIRFCLIKVSCSNDIEVVTPFLETAGFNWLFRTKSSGGLTNFVLERVYTDRVEAKCKDTVIIRPLVNKLVSMPRRAWLELTPAILQRSTRTRQDYNLLVKTIERVGVDRVVLSTDKPNPPSIRDVVSLMAAVLELEFSQLDQLIKRNNRSLEGELL
jgi:hypothetical protein